MSTSVTTNDVNNYNFDAVAAQYLAMFPIGRMKFTEVSEVTKLQFYTFRCFIHRWIPLVHRVDNSFWLNKYQVYPVLYFTDINSYQSFNNTIYNDVVRYCQINAKLMHPQPVVSDWEMCNKQPME